MRSRRPTGPLSRRVWGPPTDLDRRPLLARALGPCWIQSRLLYTAAGAGSPQRGRYGATPTARREPKASTGTDRWRTRVGTGESRAVHTPSPSPGAAVTVGWLRTSLTPLRSRPVGGPPASAEPAPSERRICRPPGYPRPGQTSARTTREGTHPARLDAGPGATSSKPLPASHPGTTRFGVVVLFDPHATHEPALGHASHPACSPGRLQPVLRRRTPGVSPGKTVIRDTLPGVHAEPGCCPGAEPSVCRDSSLQSNEFHICVSGTSNAEFWC
jgi:hypothetical protein